MLRINQILQLVIAMFILSGVVPALAQSDPELFGQGRVAIDTYHDCPAAEKAFAAVSSQGQRDPIWISYMAKTEECLGKLASALSYYEKYYKIVYENSTVPVDGQADFLTKLADLRYKVSKIQARERARAEAESNRRQQEEAERQRRAALRADAFGTLDSDLQNLVSLINSYPAPKGLKVAAFAPGKCQLEVEEKEGTGHNFTTIDFSSAAPASRSQREISVSCQPGSSCISFVDKQRDTFLGMGYKADSTPQDKDRFTWYHFANENDAEEARRLMERIAAACGKP